MPTRQKVLSVFLVLLFQGLFGLSVELSVKECAGVGSQGYPIRTVVPLQAGTYQDVNSFRLTDASGTTVPAQFDILSRAYLGDNSITNVAVTYMPAVSAFTSTGTGISKYYFKDDGAGNSTGTGLVVTEGSDAITVVTGNSLKFTVKKTGFNIIDELWYDPNNGGNFSSANLAIKSNAKGGGEFIGRLPGDIQFDADRTDLKVEVEKSGPLEAIIRVEAVTKYYSPSNHTHGWAVRIYAYAGKSHIKVDYQLQNSSKVKQYAWPLYFNAMNMNFDLNLSGALTVKTGLGNGNVYSGSLGNGVCLSQRKDSMFNVYSVDGVGDTTTVLATGGRPDGFLDIDNGSVGVTVKTRNFWQMWPNGLKVDVNKKLQVQLFPEWSCQVNVAVKEPIFNSSNLYWLADMQHVYKEVIFNFHQSASNSELINFAKTVDFHPVATMPVIYVGDAGSSLDMAGKIPLEVKNSSKDERLPPALASGQLGWYYYHLIARRTETAQAGGIPEGGGFFWASENPSDWFSSERKAIGELNIRPQWMAQYTFKDDYSLLKLGTNMDGAVGQRFNPFSWRAEDYGADIMDSAVLAESDGGVGIFPIGYATILDDAHYWHHHLKDAYWMTGNPWQKDYYKFIVEFRKRFITEMTTLSRYGGHPLACDVLQGLNAVGDTALVRMLYENMLYNRDVVRPQFGDYSISGSGVFSTSGFQAGFGIRPLTDYLSQVKANSNPQYFAEAFQLISAYMSWNFNYGNFGYNSWSPQRGNSYYGAFTLMDPQAWYYWNTGKREYYDHLMDYIDGGITVPNGVGSNPGGGPMMGDGSEPWVGTYAGRWTQFVRENTKADAVPPAAVSDLAMTRNGTQCVLTWTVPADAKRYHIVWGDRPIGYDATDDWKYLNWWAAKTVGKTLSAASGTQDQISFTVPDTGLVFAAMFTFDLSDNLSGISNVSRSDVTPATAPVNFTVTVESANQAALSWSASSDAESGIWHYNVYRNGVFIAAVDGLSFTDDGLNGSTQYNYAVAAVSGSNAEGTRAEQQVTTFADTVAPVPVAVTSISNLPEVKVTFSEALDSASAQTAANYAINRGSQVLSAVLQGDRKTVVLTCNTLVFDYAYVLTINGVKDRAITPNTTSNVPVDFVHRAPLLITNTRSADYVWDVFTIGTDCFVDQSTQMGFIPEKYEGLPLLKTGSSQRKYYDGSDSSVAFTSNKALMVYVMMDVKQTPPSWLTSVFTATGDTFPNAGVGQPTVAWEASFPAGRITIPNGGLSDNYSNYFVVVRPLDSSWTKTESGLVKEYADGLSTYPNPFNPQVSIAIQYGRVVNLDKQHNIRIFNMQGRLVTVLTPSRVKLAGRSARYEYVWNAAGYASGAYLVSATAHGKNWKKAVMLLK
jgi:hypothetical protein